MRRSVLCLVLAILSVVIVTGTEERSLATDEPRRPGLPVAQCPPERPEACFSDPTFANTYGWLGSLQRGLTGSIKAKQWAQIPMGVLATNVVFVQNPSDEDGFNFNDYYVNVFLTSNRGAPSGYGYTPEVPVRTVAFGSVPTEVRLRVAQKRDRNDLPVPIPLRIRERQLGGPGPGIGFSTKLSAEVDLDVTSLRADGVDVGITGTCRARSATLSVASEDVEVGEKSSYDQNDGLFGLYGGTMRGTIDIPAFNGCKTRTGDDVSRLLTAAISRGAGQPEKDPITLQIGAIQCVVPDSDGTLLPPPPFSSTPEDANCPEFMDGERNLPTNPRPRPIPPYAPGDGPPG